MKVFINLFVTYFKTSKDFILQVNLDFTIFNNISIKQFGLKEDGEYLE